MPLQRRYDAVLAISRSGTTTEVERLLKATRGQMPSILVTAVPGSPLTDIATTTVVLDFADESSVVQTRFATSALTLLRAHLGIDLAAAISDGEAAVRMDLPFDQALFDHFVFLGLGWTVGLAHEAALKMEETAGARTEAFSAMEYRHGPVSAAGPRTLAWGIGDVPSSVLDDVTRTGACIRRGSLDGMAELILVQRMALARAVALGRDPDRPPFLTRSVILD
jgi:fructoselysine-6-P-deglycase FrlB-like protein